MTNNQLCNLMGAAGCFIAFIGMGLVFFGITAAGWAVALGVLLGVLSLINYD